MCSHIRLFAGCDALLDQFLQTFLGLARKVVTLRDAFCAAHVIEQSVANADGVGRQKFGRVSETEQHYVWMNYTKPLTGDDLRALVRKKKIEPKCFHFIAHLPPRDPSWSFLHTRDNPFLSRRAFACSGWLVLGKVRALS
jgi:hypothetical protein